MMRIADRWFDFRRVDDAITLISEPHTHPLVRCNIWHVRGRDRDLMIDTGMGIASLRHAATHLLDKHVTAVATHSHFDHVGGFHEFEDRVIHRAEADLVGSTDNWGTLVSADLGPAILEFCAHDEPALGELLIDALPAPGYDPRAYHLEPAPPTRRVEEGDVIDIGNRHFEVLHLPGHSPGSMGLWEAATGTLFSGDAIYDGPLLYTTEDADIAAYIRTMERLRDLPVTVVHGGHEPSFGRARLIEIADHYLSRW